MNYIDLYGYFFERRNMQVALDVSSLDSPYLSGVGTYITHLFEELKHLDSLTCHPVVRWSRRKKSSQIEDHIDSRPHLSFWGRRLPQFEKFDVWHGPDFRIPPLLPTASVVTIHDLAFYERGMTSPEFAEKRIRLLEATLKRTPKTIITVSEHTRRCLLTQFPDLKIPVKAVHLGADHLMSPTLESEQTAPCEKQSYFLFVGNLEARKNVTALLKAFDLFCERRSGFELVLIGRPGYGYDEIHKAHGEMKFSSNVKMLGYLSPQELKAYYRQASGFLYPSLHEGFGIPLLEAMSLECPILTANRTATKEVAGEAALLIDPLDIESIAAGMFKLLDAELSKTLVQKGLERFKDFTWKSTAAQTAEVYSSVLEQSQSLKNF